MLHMTLKKSKEQKYFALI